ncbi:LysR family transcriptional regulator [Novosphingobium sp.]|uniref:LysR family transcriptional regulator n=1 Tax=Novosphingobium sp. TaxID=1874826 RepID=UPI003341DD5C
MDRFDAMKTLIAAVDGGSLSAASRKLGMPLATVSRKVSELEAHLHAQLVVRTSRKLLLTEAGEGYVLACRRILEDIDDAERTAAGEYRVPRGHLTITAPVMFGKLHVEPVVLAFLKAYPEIQVRMVLNDHVITIADHQIDAAIRIGPLPDSSMRALQLGAIRWVVCGSPDYLGEHGVPQTPHDLAQHDCVMFEGLHSTDMWSNAAWSFGADAAALSIPIAPRLRVNTAEAARAAAVAGTGLVRLLSYQVADAVAAGALRLILTAWEPPAIPVQLVHPGQAILPLKLRAFLDFAAPRLRAALRPGPGV